MINYKNKLISITLLVILSFFLVTQFIKAETISSYKLTQKVSFNQVTHYPVSQTVDTSSPYRKGVTL